MKSLADNDDPEWMHLVPAAQYNLGRAYFQGYGVPQSDVEAENLWILAAKDGDPSGSVKAQSTLGMFYSREGEAAYDMKKVFISITRTVFVRQLHHLLLLTPKFKAIHDLRQKKFS